MSSYKCIPWEDVNVGDHAEMRVVMDDAQVLEFSALIGDTESFHVKEESAALTPFKTRICHGVHLLAYVSVLIGKELPGFGTIYCSHEFEFFAPVYIGEEIFVRVEVLEKLDHRRLKMNTTIRLPDGGFVLKGTAVVKTHK
ncbi:MAG: hypothetical protein IJP92_17625 [Lachnospiraceae bacterium]|nr:hypothetical protein [Lachnospiraceae bacterium]